MVPLIYLGFIEVELVDIIDILLMAYLLYELYRLLKGTIAINIFLGILAIFFAWKLFTALQMELMKEFLGAFMSAGFIALFIIFQPEIRDFLLHLGTPTLLKKGRKLFFFLNLIPRSSQKLNIDTVVNACAKMAQTKTGALIVVAYKNDLEKYSSTGEDINANLSAELIQNIFFKNSPLHDGAMIINNNRIKSARCILPVSGNPNIPHNLGLRHRSAIGITEITDAISVIVSEETGSISVAQNGSITQEMGISELKNFLEKALS